MGTAKNVSVMPKTYRVFFIFLFEVCIQLRYVLGMRRVSVGTTSVREGYLYGIAGTYWNFF